MGKHTDQRDRTLLLARILQEETDEKHPLSMAAILEKLGQQGVTAGRKSLYRDIAALRKHGWAVAFRPGQQGGWYLSSRTFSPEELRTLIDAVSVYRWLDREKREVLVEKLTGLAARPQRPALQRPVSVHRRSAAQPEQVQAAVDRIHAALQAQRALSFLPVQYEAGSRQKVGSTRCIISPKGLLWAQETYHLLAWDHRDKALRLYRPDRMADLRSTGLPAQGPEADTDLWNTAPFGLDPARKERVRLRFGQAIAGEVLDRFGGDIAPVPDEECFLLTTDVVVGAEFWGWMASHGDWAEVLAPAWAARQWQQRYRPGALRETPAPAV